MNKYQIESVSPPPQQLRQVSNYKPINWLTGLYTNITILPSFQIPTHQHHFPLPPPPKKKKKNKTKKKSKKQPNFSAQDYQLHKVRSKRNYEIFPAFVKIYVLSFIFTMFLFWPCFSESHTGAWTDGIRSCEIITIKGN